MPRKIPAGDLQSYALAPIMYTLYIKMTRSRQLELILLHSRAIPLFTRQRYKNVVFSANCNAASLK
jgi:hypothetical protein